MGLCCEYLSVRQSTFLNQHSSIIRPVWLNGWVFVYELSGCGFESTCSHLNFRFRACFEQRVPWHSGKTIKCRFTLKQVRDMIRTYSQFFLYFAKWNFLAQRWTRWLPTTSILVVIGRLYRYQFKCNYLKNQKPFLNFLLHFWNLH